jgi:hypothetical protein
MCLGKISTRPSTDASISDPKFRIINNENKTVNGTERQLLKLSFRRIRISELALAHLSALF